MMYKTIVLELIQERPELYERLRSSKMLLTTMEAYAIELKETHEAWKDRLHQENPNRDPRQIAGEALELAVLGLSDRLPCESPKAEAELMIDEAMAFLRHHTPPA